MHVHGDIGSPIELGPQLSNPSVDDVDAAGVATVSISSHVPSLRSVRIVHHETYGPERTYQKLQLPWETVTTTSGIWANHPGGMHESSLFESPSSSYL
ncbi:hypothetical protein C8J56DRAFT_1019290, partial [Mycena floridula]